MDSLANWASVGALSAGMAGLGNLDRNLDFASCSNAGLNPLKPPNLECDGRLSELNALNSDWMKLMGLSSAGPNGEGDRAGLTISLSSADEEFGHWRPVYDEKTRPTFSVTGTEIWQTQKGGSGQAEKTTDWNLTDVTKTSAAVTAMESLQCLLRDEEVGSEKSHDDLRDEMWRGSLDVQSKSSSMLDLGSSVDCNAGWGTTPICQEKPWDLHNDRAVLETSVALALRQEMQKPRDPSQDCGLDLWKNTLMAGEPVGGLTGQKSRGFNDRSQELFPKSDASDDVTLQLELQKLALMDSHSPDGLTSGSRRGSSVSSIDGISLSSLVGRGERKDPDPSCETLSWAEQRKRLPSQRDDWNHGNSGLQLYSGLQSPSGWSSLPAAEKTPPIVDNGTAVWSTAANQDKVGEDTLAWVKLLRTQSFPPPPPSVFDIDMSVPPPPLNAPPVLPLGVGTPAPPGLSLPPMLSNLQSSSNLTARKLGSPLSQMAGPGGLVSPSTDISDKPWSYSQQFQQQPVERQRSWMGNQWINSDQWNMQRKHQYETTRQQSLGLHNDALNTGSLNSDPFRGSMNMHPMQYRAPSVVHNKAPQTRSKLIQQLVNMGFKKEDAQNALITHNMDLKKALAELITKKSLGPLPYYDPRQNSFVGGVQLAPNADNVRDILRSSLGALPGHAIGGGGGSGLSDTTLDLSKLLSGSMGWDSLMQTSSSPLQMLQSGRSSLSAGPLPPPLLHSSLQLPPTMHPNARGQESSAGMSQDNLRQLSDLALCRMLVDSSRSSQQQADAELLQLFAKTLSASNSIVPPSRDGSSAIYSHGNGLLAGLKLPDHLGSAIHGGLYQNPIVSPGPNRSASVEPKAVPGQKGLHGFDLSSSLIGRQFSLNLASSANQDAAVGLSRSDASSSLQSLPTDVASGHVDLPKLTPKLEIKEFIPGVPWKGARETGDPMPAVPAMATAFKDAETEWPTQTQGKAVEEDSARKKGRPSKWLELKNISDQLDDMTLQDLCTRHGQIKVFTRQIDGSLLVSYVDLDDAIAAQGALDQYVLNGAPITAEFVKDWTDAGAGSTTNESDSLGYMRPDGLWIPPDADGEPVYYSGADKWCEGYDASQPEERWNSGTAFDPATSTACEEPSSQKE